MSTPSLHELSRDALIEEARTLGVVRPEVFTRAELQDEIVKRRETDPKQRQRARGLLGLARDLLASVVEKGLHLPEVAEKLRAAAPPPVPAPREPMATVTLAEIYVAQGHAAKAKKILDEVLQREPDHAAARALLEKLGERPVTATAASAVAPVSSAPTAAAAEAAQLPVAAAAVSPPRPRPMLDEVPLPSSYGVEEVVAMPVDPTTALIYWETRRAPADTVIELELLHASGHRESRTIPVGAAIGEYVARGLPSGAKVTAKLGARRDMFSVPRAVASVATPPRFPSPRLARGVARFQGDRFVAVRPVESKRMVLTLALADAAPRPAPPAPHRPQIVGGSSELRLPVDDRSAVGSSDLRLR